MKTTITIILFALIQTITAGQTITDKRLEFNKSVKNIFSPKSRNLEVSLEQIYEDGSQDTTTHVKFFAERSDIEQTGTSSSLAFVGSFVGSGVGSTYDVNKIEGLEFLTIQEVDDLLSCLKTVDSHLRKYKQDGIDHERIITCSAKTIVVSHIFKKNKQTKYIIQVGRGESTYEIPYADFSEFRIMLFKTIKLFPHLINGRV